MIEALDVTQALLALGLCQPSDIEEAQARQIIYGGDLELNLLEMRLVTEASLVEALHSVASQSGNAGSVAPPGPLRVDAESSLRVRAVASGAMARRTPRGTFEIYVAAQPNADVRRAIATEFGQESRVLLTTSLRLAEASALLEGTPLDARTLTQLTRTGQRLEGFLPAVATLPAPSSLASGKPGVGQRPVETAPPPAGYQELTRNEAPPLAAGTATPKGVRLSPERGERPPSPAYEKAAVEADLRAARDGDEVVEFLLRFCAQFFEYVAIFGIQSTEAKGLGAVGPGASAERVKSLRVPLDVSSIISRVKDSGQHQVARLRASGLEGGLVRDLERPLGRAVLLLPVAVRNKTLVLVWADDGPDDVDLDRALPTLGIMRVASSALERVLIERKRAGRVSRASLVPDVRTQYSSLPPEAAPPARPSPLPPSSDSEPPKRFPSDNPKTMKGFPGGEPPAGPSRLRPVSSPVPRVAPPLLSRRIVAVSEPASAPARQTIDAAASRGFAQPIPSKAAAPDPASSSVDSSHTTPGKGETMLSRRVAAEELEGYLPQQHPSPHPSPPPLSYKVLVEQLVGGNEDAFERLVRGGESAVGALIATFPGPTVEPRAPTTRASECGPILQAIVAIGSKAIPFLTVRTRDENAQVRRWAVFLLGELPGRDAARAIADRLLDDVAEVRRAALISARRVQSDQLTRRTLRSRLEEMTRDSQLTSDERCAAIEAIADIREHESIPTLLQLLDDESAAIKRAARWALSVLTRHDYGSETEKWRQFWQSHRNEPRHEWLLLALRGGQADLARAAADELEELTGKPLADLSALDDAQLASLRNHLLQANPSTKS